MFVGSLVCCGWAGFGNCVLGLVGWGCCGWFLGGEFGGDLIFGWWGYNSPSGLSSVWLRCFLLGVDLVGLGGWVLCISWIWRFFVC